MKISRKIHKMIVSEFEPTLDLSLQLELGEDHPMKATLLKLSLSADGRPVLPAEGCWYKSTAFDEKFAYVPQGSKGDLVEIPLIVGSKPFDSVCIELAPWIGGKRDMSRLISTVVVSAGLGMGAGGKSTNVRTISLFSL